MPGRAQRRGAPARTATRDQITGRVRLFLETDAETADGLDPAQQLERTGCHNQVATKLQRTSTMEHREYTSSGFIERRSSPDRRHDTPVDTLYGRIEARLRKIEDDRRQSRGRRWNDKAVTAVRRSAKSPRR